MSTPTVKKPSALLLSPAMHAASIVSFIVCTGEQGAARVSIAARNVVLPLL